MSDNLKEIISSDPFSVKKQLIQLADKHFGTKSIDLYESGYLGYFIQSNTLLTSDAMYNLGMSYNEAFTQLALLPSSIGNLASMFDYELDKSKPCYGQLLMSVQFPIDTPEARFIIKNGTPCTSTGGIPYKVKGSYIVTVGEKPSVQYKDPFTGMIIDLPYDVEIKQGIRYLIFFIDIWQVRIYEYDFQFDAVELEKFYEVNISGFKDQFYDIQLGVHIKDNDDLQTRLLKFKRVTSLYSAGPEDRVFTFLIGAEGNATIRFGNGIFGYQPESGSSGYLVIYTTMGVDGKVNPKTIEYGEKLTDIYTNRNLDFSSTNITGIDNGESQESIDMARRHIIEQISSARRLVTGIDYAGFEGVTGMRNTKMKPLLLRRDTNTNEIDLFHVIYDSKGRPIPTDSITVYTPDTSTHIPKETVFRFGGMYGDSGGMYAAMNTMPSWWKTDPTKIPDHKFYVYLENPLTEDSEWKLHNDTIAYYNKTTSLWEYTEPSFRTSYVVPYNVLLPEYTANYLPDPLKPGETPYQQSSRDSRAFYQFIPSSVTDLPTIQDQLARSNVDFIINYVLVTPSPISEDEDMIITPTDITLDFYVEYDGPGDPTLLTMETIFKSSSNPLFDMKVNPKITAIDNVKNIMTFSVTMSLHDMYGKSFESIECTLYYDTRIYNTFNAPMLIEKTSEELNDDIVDNQIKFSYGPPQIDRVNMGINKVVFQWSTTLSDNGTPPKNVVSGFLLDIHVTKLDTMNIDKVKCKFGFANRQMQEMNVKSISARGTTVIYTLEIPYNQDTFPEGNLDYTIDLEYKFNDPNGVPQTNFTTYCRYGGSVILDHTLRNLMWSNTWTLKDMMDYITRMIERNKIVGKDLFDFLYRSDQYGANTIPVFRNDKDGGFGGSLYNVLSDIYQDDVITDASGYFIYRIPVIEKSYYEENKKYLNEIFMYSASQVDIMFNSHRMLTDGCNMKFARTHGIIYNLRYNDNIRKIPEDLKYGNWTTDLAPTFKIKIFIRKNPTRIVRDIVAEAKSVILTFLQLKADFDAKIVRSEVSRYLHDVIPDITSCEVLKPTRDILYMYTETNLPKNKHLILSYVPEFVWIDINKIEVIPIVLP